MSKNKFRTRGPNQSAIIPGADPQLAQYAQAAQQAEMVKAQQQAFVQQTGLNLAVAIYAQLLLVHDGETQPEELADQAVKLSEKYLGPLLIRIGAAKKAKKPKEEESVKSDSIIVG